MTDRSFGPTKCDICGRFCKPVAWQMVYSGVLPEPDHEIFRCAPCVEKYGTFCPQDGIQPDFSCGTFEDSKQWTA